MGKGKVVWPESVTPDFSRRYWEKRDEAARAIRAGVRGYYVYRQRAGDTAAQAVEATRAEVERLLDALERGE